MAELYIQEYGTSGWAAYSDEIQLFQAFDAFIQPAVFGGDEMIGFGDGGYYWPELQQNDLLGPAHGFPVEAETMNPLDSFWDTPSGLESIETAQIGRIEPALSTEPATSEQETFCWADDGALGARDGEEEYPLELNGMDRLTLGEKDLYEEPIEGGEQ